MPTKYCQSYIECISKNLLANLTIFKEENITLRRRRNRKIQIINLDMHIEFLDSIFGFN